MSLQKEARQTLKLAIPIILGELAQLSLHLIDTAMIGVVSYKQLAAAALVLNVINVPFVFGIGITIAVAQWVSLASGKNDKQLVSHYFYNGFWLCGICGIIISVALACSANILHYMKQDPEVVTLAIPLMRLMSFSIIPMILFMTLKQFADGLQYTRTAMIISLSAIPLNAFLNWLLIYGNLGFPRMELTGAGYATLITRTVIFIALLLVILKHPVFKRYMAVAKTQWVLKTSTIKDLLRIGLPSSLQVGLEVAAFAVSGILIGTISAQAQAAHQIALSCAAAAFMASMGLSQAGSIRISNAYGGDNKKQIIAIGKSTIAIAVIYGVACCIGFVLFRHQLPRLFNNDPEVLHIASTLLLFAAIFQISDATQAVSAGLLRGIKDVNVPTYIIAIAYWVVCIPIGIALAFKANLAENGIWLGLIIGLSLSAVFLTIRFFKKTLDVRR